MLKKLFGVLLGKSNKEESVQPASVITSPIVYIFEVNGQGDVKLTFKCQKGMEEDFGRFLSSLVEGGFNEDILEALSNIFSIEDFESVVHGMNMEMGGQDDDLESGLIDEQPLVMPSQVFSGISST